MRVLVTGSSGRIGRHVVAALGNAGHEVRGFDRVAPRDRAYGTWVIGDCENLGQLCAAAAGCAAIVHLAAIAAPGMYPDVETFRNNVVSCFCAYEAAHLVGIRAVVSTSSQSAFGWAWGTRDFVPDYLPVDEAHPDQPDDCYGLSKVVGEQIAATFHRKSAMVTTVVRPPLVTFPGDDLGPHIRRRRWRETLFSYIDVRDLADVFVLALERRSPGCAVLNVCADDSLADEPLCDLLPRLDPRFEGMAAGLTGTRPMVSNARAKEALGWQPRHSWREPSAG